MFKMNKIQKKTKEYVVYSPDSLNYVTNEMYNILNNSIKFYKELFEIEKFRKIQLNFFDNINDFRNFIYNLRGEQDSLPDYAKGTYDNGMINAFIEPNLIINSSLYNKKLYLASHELFHIMYQELILKKENKTRVIWFDEGMAQFFSCECDEELSDKNFCNWFKLLINNSKEIPNLNDLNHRTGFETKNYSGYKLSLLSVKYLYETLPLFEFKKLMHNPDEIITYGATVLNDAINYYNEKCNKINYKKK